jgi:hypothetical protein
MISYYRVLQSSTYLLVNFSVLMLTLVMLNVRENEEIQCYEYKCWTGWI